ncbi:Fur family transcriptional regulator [Polymorphum gilvum]|uniref:Ferric uptake regulation protein n=1 Tax=Polymorphum gilvum (strain LMG 25793 / CGMCC 1.9160 / SL003B-26A1) TaxID=991905 RepID=F2J568_POLGS|nr:Fur family transcriptional regulator [Polymorphum gilvum]ADZ71127.1 Zinc uptake transcriptional regulator protein, Fur family protein [Polymorphum gilvum SL003B-26A1]
MTAHSHHRSDLTRNQALVYGALSDAGGPLTAYTILDRLRDDGFRAPLQVYRALDKLVEFGLVHRLESLNAFVACRHPDCEEHETIAFAICEKCGGVIEFADDRITANLKAWAKQEGFALAKTTIELRGLCRACQAA